jgi:hypothetical protein
MDDEVAKSNPQPRPRDFRCIHSTLASLVFGVKSLPLVKWSVGLLIVLWCVESAILVLFPDIGQDSIVDRGTKRILLLVPFGTLEWLVILPMIWSTAYRTLATTEGKAYEKYDKQEWRAAIAVLKTYGLIALCTFFWGLLTVFVRVALLDDTVLGVWLDIRDFKLINWGLGVILLMLTTWFWSVFLLALPLAIDGQSKVLSLSALQTKGYVFKTFCGITVIIKLTAVLSVVVSKSANFLPDSMDLASDIVQSAVEAVIYAIGTLATVYFARCIQLHRGFVSLFDTE